jgi:hypothetical protein
MNEVNGTAPVIKPYTVKQLAEIYSVSQKVLKTWIDDISEEVGQKKGHYYNPRQVKVIFDHFAYPTKVKA